MTTVTTLFSAEEIARRVAQLGSEVAGRMEGDFLIIGLLKGSFMFLADLVRALDQAGVAPQIEFMRISSYGNSKTSSGDIHLSCDISTDVAGRQILLVDDIVDTGRSLQRVKHLLDERGADRVLSCTLLDKPGRREVDCRADFIGFTIEDVFVVGYGIDYAEKYRHLPYVGYVD